MFSDIPNVWGNDSQNIMGNPQDNTQELSDALQNYPDWATAQAQDAGASQNTNVPEPKTAAPTYTTPQYGAAVTPTPEPTPTATSPAPTQSAMVVDPSATYAATTTPAATDPNSFAAINARLASPGYDQQYVNAYAGPMRQDLQNTADASRRELANRLGTAGVEGGVAQDQLGAIDRTAAMGTASGLSDILQNAMTEGFTNQRAAAQNQLSSVDKQLTAEAIKQQYGLQTYEDQQKFTQTLLQLAQNASAPEAATLMQMAMALLSGDTAVGTGN